MTMLAMCSCADARKPLFLALLLTVFFTRLSSTEAEVIIYQSEDAFTADLGDPQNFGAINDPTFGGDITFLSHYEVTHEVNEKIYSFVFREGEFNSHGLPLGNDAANSPNAYMFPLTVDEIDTSQSNFRIEAGTSTGGNGTQQGGGSIPEWGIDTDGPFTEQQVSPNTVALFDFTASPTDVLSFSMRTVDFEGGNAWSNGVAAYRNDGSLIDAVNFDFPPPAHGNGTVNFVGFGADEPIGFIAFIAGEDDALGVGGTERIAMGDFRTGLSPLIPNVPEPSGIQMVIIAISTGFIVRRKRRMNLQQDRR